MSTAQCGKHQEAAKRAGERKRLLIFVVNFLSVSFFSLAQPVKFFCASNYSIYCNSSVKLFVCACVMRVFVSIIIQVIIWNEELAMLNRDAVLLLQYGSMKRQHIITCFIVLIQWFSCPWLSACAISGTCSLNCSLNSTAVNGGYCNQPGECLCREGYEGTLCDRTPSLSSSSSSSPSAAAPSAAAGPVAAIAGGVVASILTVIIIIVVVAIVVLTVLARRMRRGEVVNDKYVHNSSHGNLWKLYKGY